ncbi:MAG: hypothetical protein AAB225_12155 [Acidobacteriota bacterium]
MSAAALKLDIGAAVAVGLLEIVFVFYFVVLFDNVGTLIGVTKKAGLLFVLALFVAPVVGVIPAAATVPALFVVRFAYLTSRE